MTVQSGNVISFNLGRCDVCGHRMENSFMRPWNGKDVCSPCIRQLNEEAELVNG
ncbi:hypothetical protein [Paenibacillus methanolicus]|uniref:Inhibitor of sigma-G Gin protein n=1 Tax=Paenibacillus methanolicus TaxID=582686 RepID=A0A5S5BRB0_9BACL|nr:hypothetical protein [Paenibacillus methanolicus]TYP68908.1 hypothetical protein BCM02_11726 [Paenibacillus methanolicus]